MSVLYRPQVAKAGALEGATGQKLNKISWSAIPPVIKIYYFDSFHEDYGNNVTGY